ncbi:hypothetical protein ACQR09_13375 [Bradyrhizobium oligotrophicum]|uniref:hypothetical protein n=1 Tax=Bradyrhizobium oligotrophicum TaxID=44255 RepID=UPI003EBD0421
MLDQIRHYLRLRKLQEKRRRARAHQISGTWSALDKMTGPGEQASVRRVVLEGENEIGRIDFEINQLQTDYLLEQARKYLIPVPDAQGDEWIEVAFGAWALPPETLADLRAQIRKERKERWEHWQMRLTLLIGFGGMLIGLISLLKK